MINEPGNAPNGMYWRQKVATSNNIAPAIPPTTLIKGVLLPGNDPLSRMRIPPTSAATPHAKIRRGVSWAATPIMIMLTWRSNNAIKRP